MKSIWCVLLLFWRDNHVAWAVMLDIAVRAIDEGDIKRLLHPLTGGVILFCGNYGNHRQLTELTQQIHALRIAFADRG